MNNTNTGGPAFPVADPFKVKCPDTETEALRLQQGMTLRDYFAAKAMQGVVSGLSTRGEPLNYKECALFSYELADAMLKAREQCTS
jgi:hypothetical protein